MSYTVMTVAYMFLNAARRHVQSISVRTVSALTKSVHIIYRC